MCLHLGPPRHSLFYFSCPVYGPIANSHAASAVPHSHATVPPRRVSARSPSMMRHPLSLCIRLQDPCLPRRCRRPRRPHLLRVCLRPLRDSRSPLPFWSAATFLFRRLHLWCSRRASGLALVLFAGHRLPVASSLRGYRAPCWISVV